LTRRGVLGAERVMKLAFSTNAYLNHSFADAAARIAKLGYAGLELMADVPHAWPAFLLPESKKAIRDAMAANRLAFSNVNAFMMHAVNDPRQKYWHPSWIEPDPHYRQIRIDHTKRALTLAKELGAPCITTEPGGPLEGRPWGECLKLFIEMLKPVVEHAEKEGVLLLVEPEPDLLIETADQYLEFASKIQSPKIGLNFDIGHFYCVKDEPAPTVYELKEHIRHVHLEDIAATRVHHHLVPGEGVIDFVATFRALSDVGYNGWVTVELYTCHENPDAAAQVARERVVPLANRAGVAL
jgi:sugar phosphate isomerase/epimerase